jgi:hypothetical protein
MQSWQPPLVQDAAMNIEPAPTVDYLGGHGDAAGRRYDAA